MIVSVTNYALNKTIEALTLPVPTQYQMRKAKTECKELADYICQACGVQKSFGIQIDAHHRIPVHVNPMLAAVIENLICLCRLCHYLLAHFRNWKHYNDDLDATIRRFRHQYTAEKRSNLQIGGK